MTDNPVIHVMYTFFCLCVDNVSTIAAGILFTLQFIILLPKAISAIKKWRNKNGN